MWSLGGWRPSHLSVAFKELPTGIPLCPFQLLQPGPQLIGFLLSCHLGLLKQQQLLLLLLLGPLKTEQATGWLDPGPRASRNSLGICSSLCPICYMLPLDNLWLRVSLKLRDQKCGLCSLPPLSFPLTHPYLPLCQHPRDHMSSLTFRVTHRDVGSLAC